jgi:hypothetical protein
MSMEETFFVKYSDNPGMTDEEGGRTFRFGRLSAFTGTDTCYCFASGSRGGDKPCRYFKVEVWL